ncbi:MULTISPECIES: 30S ribosomal protein S12 methylthiotransferase RimO [unclassified Modestobacter]|uniref:30S ribosomal protein S12 methylthiotransferase RimO n=1 Tax=unclassified Modestobacter TaxID=2643866 RepID=UPI0022AA6BE5|nr:MULTISPECIES: 30S ribosomal protein S12 methylthiotransferase RimO [unclassified Modestobacter]MCZ2826837.1 30S ribosomal protein S12 methylthiotransferase RimO [Modestobacter sp. VKM Ac-2981]MCZ2855217.1 30S ribosomal protein S12 methylthiotransferase RimO [Modestobacter sp. VKM Ac-2982]
MTSPEGQPAGPAPRRVAVVTLGCARNEVDSEELAGRLAGDGYELVADGEAADAVLVNTCGFIESAKKDSVDAILAATDSGAEVIAVGCMAERYGAELAGALPEATVLGFDDYGAIGDRLDDVLTGRPLVPHTPKDRRTLLPISPVQRTAATQAPDAPAIPGHDWLRRKRLASGPSAALKIASGCDRRCAFCAIPTFRGSFVSRPAGEVLGEAQWLASQGVTEIVLVSENSTSYGKDTGDLRSLEKLLPQLAAVDGIARVRVAYLQPAELRPGLLEVIAATPGIAPYFDLSFQHSSPTLLRRMRRFGGTEDFLGIIERARALAPGAGFRTNVILGFPGETEDDVAELERFLTEGRLDAVGVFGYSDEDGTEALGLPGKHDQVEIDARVRRITDLVEELTAQRAEERIGSTVEVLLTEDLSDDEEPGTWAGHAAHQDPDADGTTTVSGVPADAVAGQLVQAEVVDTEGVDLVARALLPAHGVPALVAPAGV